MAPEHMTADDLQHSALQALQQGDLHRARALFAEARIAYRETGKARGEALCWHRLGAVSLRSGDLDEAVTCFGTARDLCQQNQDGQGFANALHQIGTILMQRQQYEQARAHSRSALSVQHEIGDRAGVARSLYQIACAFMEENNIAMEENNIAEAVTGYRHAIKVMKSVEDLAGVAMSFYHLALLAHRTGRAGGAYRLMLVCAGIQQATGDADAAATMEDAQVLAQNAGAEAEDFSQTLREAIRGFADDDGETLITATFPEIASTAPPA